MVFGDMTEGVPTPLPGITIGAYQTSGYSLFVIAMSIVAIVGVYIILRSSRLGLLARGTMQNADMAAALGTDTSRIYAVTFAFGAALAGLAGGILAPVSGVFPEHRRLLYRPRLHHRHRRRRGAAGRHRLRVDACSASSTRSRPSRPTRSMAKWRFFSPRSF